MSEWSALFYGESKVGKTSQLGLAAAYIYSVTGKPIRYVSADNGGWRPIQPLVSAGIIEPISLIGLPTRRLWMWIRKLAQGGWPAKVDSEGYIEGEDLTFTKDLG